MFKLIHLPAFIISLSLGLFLVYITGEKPETIYLYPNPDNADDLLYKDQLGTCHKFHPKEVECPKNKKLITEYPVQVKKVTME